MYRHVPDCTDCKATANETVLHKSYCFLLRRFYKTHVKYRNINNIKLKIELIVIRVHVRIIASDRHMLMGT